MPGKPAGRAELAMNWRRGLFAVLALIAVACTYILSSEPHLRAYLCPACLGFREIAPRVHADSQASDAQIDAALDSMNAAQGRLAQAYPDRVATPVWLLCLSGNCGVAGGPRPLAMAYMNLFVFVYPDGANATILTHELAHAELHARLGTARRLLSQPVPTWFDEGVAVLVSKDPRYLEIANGVVTGCKAGDWPEPPSDQRTFRRRAATQAEALYTASACRVIDWLADKGGVSALPDMVTRIRAGVATVE
ncbi:MAG: hypothetical protein GVY34_12880 [Alphaproteobacteria bacterium]|jgi:hypothetical protein|nr:hypothetical protein [Alphaproteobacteria bacterium]